MANIEYKKIPRHINSIPQFLWWEIDDFAIFMGFSAIGVFTPYSLYFAGAGAGFAYIHSKTKSSFVKGYSNHLLYSFGLRKVKGMPDGMTKEIIR
jgi:hypothetical protein